MLLERDGQSPVILQIQLMVIVMLDVAFGSTVNKLKSAIAGETHEYTDMYLVMQEQKEKKVGGVGDGDGD